MLYARARRAMAPATAYAMGPFVACAAALLLTWRGAEVVGVGVDKMIVVPGALVVAGGAVTVLAEVKGMVL